jgi:hypothetical protein
MPSSGKQDSTGLQAWGGRTSNAKMRIETPDETTTLPAKERREDP